MSVEEPLRILVVDDSALYRQLLRNVLRDVPGIEWVGGAKSGEEALAQIRELDPDLLALDVQMPGMTGLDVLRELKQKRLRTKAIMLSSFTAAGAQVTTDALFEGAFDFILKPTGADANVNRQALLSVLREKIAAFQASGVFRSAMAQRGGAALSASSVARRASAVRTADASPKADDEQDHAGDAGVSCNVVVIGTSTGGPVALREVLPRLAEDFPVPILIVQHMPAQFTHSLAQRLNELSPLEVVEACDGMTLEPGWAYLAPGDRHMKVVRQGRRSIIQLTDDPPENSCRPSVDYLFRSAAEVFGGRVIAVVMTGMGRDGMEGCRALKRHGAFVIAQHPEGCVVYGMPKAVVDENLHDRLLPLERIAPALSLRVRLGGPSA